ncbi:MAG: ATP-dependent Clp protease ATP-binding subunit [Sandaracinus sp.]
MNAAGLKGLIAQARYVAARRSQRFSTGHCVLTMLGQGDDSAAILVRAGVSETALVSALKVEGDEPSAVLERASERAGKLATETQTALGTLHLLAAIAREPQSAASRCFERMGVPMSRVEADVRTALGLSTPARAPTLPPPPASRLGVPMMRAPSSELPPARPRPNRRIAPALRPAPVETRTAAPPVATPAPIAAAPAAEPATPFAIDARKFPLLAQIGTNLTAQAAAGAIDPVLARETELERLLDVISRRRANHPLLVGPSGVGKTAVVHALALAVAHGAPETKALTRRVVVEVSAGSLVSGTGVRGALSEKLRKLAAEAEAAGDVMLFFDDVHAILGGPESDGEVASELKALLARGEVPCIAATSEAEAKRFLDRDPALARRFSLLPIAEPSPKDATAILRGVIHRYEAHHGLAYRSDAIAAAVELAVRFLPEKQLPDKALSVLDLAGARLRRSGGTVVDVPAVAQVIAEQAHVPVERLLLRDADRLLALETVLEERVVGQRSALARISDALRKGAAGFRGKRPLATFLFLGTTGVGKTETAKAIAEAMFGEANVVRFDMSELSESHAVARLLGAPPGYVGHDAGGQLTEAVRRRPYSLVLLDEIEKAHPEVLLSLLPLLDEGRLTDGRGRTVDFTNTVIVLTSNLGADAVRGPAAIGFGSTPSAADRARSLEEKVLAAARRAMPPELWNRLDEPLVFSPLGREDALEIARRMLRAIGATMEREHGVTVVAETSALSALADAGGFDPALGARPMRRVVSRLVESPLAARVLAGDLRRGDRVVLRGEGTRVALEFDDAAEIAGDDEVAAEE